MTAEEKALEMYPDKDDLFNIGTEDNFTHNEIAFLERVAFRRGWNDRDSLVEVDKKEAVKEFKGALLNYILGNIEYGEVYKIIDLLTSEDK